MSHSVRGTRKRIVAGLTAAAVAASGLAALGASSAGAAQTVTVTRLSGANRYATAANVATNTYQPAGTVGAIGARPRANVILASGENFPDGLAAAGLAGAVDSPILLTGMNSLPVETSNALAVLGASTVHVMGGTGVISQAVRDQVAALGYTLVETYSGTNRYDTAAKIAAAIGNGNIGGFGGKRTAILAVGNNYADALAAGSIAFKGKHPILLTDSAALSTETNAALTSLGIQQVIIMGGTSAVSAAVADAITAKGITVVRIAGDDRADTARDLANILVTPTGSGGFGMGKTTVVLYNGYDGFADGLAAGPRAGKADAVALPVDDASVATPTNEFITANKATIAGITVIGGTSVISDATATAAKDAAAVGVPTATITGVQGGSSVTITFSESINPASIDATDFALSSTAPAETIGAVAAVVGTSNKSFTVAIAGSVLDAGDTVALIDGATVDGLAEVTTAAAGVKTGLASLTIAADTTKPTVSIVSSPGRSFTVTFSESVTPALTAGAIPGGTNVDDLFVLAQGTGVSVPTMTGVSTVTANSTNTSFVVTWTTGTALVAGNTITAAATNFTDLAGNTNLVAVGTVATDSVNPSLSSASVTTTKTGVDSLATVQGANNVVLTSKTTGDSGLSFEILGAGVPTNPALTFNSTTGVISITLGATAGTNTGPALAALVNGNATLAALLTASGGGAGDMVAAAAAPLAGGTTTNDVTVVFSETVVIAANTNVKLDVDGNLATLGDQSNIGQVGVQPGGSMTAAGAGTVVAGVSKVIVSNAVLDLAGLAVTDGSTATVVAAA